MVENDSPRLTIKPEVVKLATGLVIMTLHKRHPEPPSWTLVDWREELGEEDADIFIEALGRLDTIDRAELHGCDLLVELSGVGRVLYLLEEKLRRSRNECDPRIQACLQAVMGEDAGLVLA